MPLPLVSRFAPALRVGRKRQGVEMAPMQEEMLLAGVAGVMALHLDLPGKLPGGSLVAQLIELVLMPYLDSRRAKQIASDY